MDYSEPQSRDFEGLAQNEYWNQAQKKTDESHGQSGMRTKFGVWSSTVCRETVNSNVTVSDFWILNIIKICKFKLYQVKESVIPKVDPVVPKEFSKVDVKENI